MSKLSLKNKHEVPKIDRIILNMGLGEDASDGKKIKSGFFTVFHNGVLIHNHVEILGTTENVGPPKNISHGDGPIALQNHCCSQISFRNIWVRELN